MKNYAFIIVRLLLDTFHLIKNTRLNSADINDVFIRFYINLYTSYFDPDIKDICKVISTSH